MLTVTPLGADARPNPSAVSACAASLFDSASWQARRRGHAGSHREAVQDSSWATTCSSDETDLLGSARPHPHTARGAGSHDTMPLPPATRTRA